MRVLAIVHQRDAGPGVFTDRIRARGTLETWYPAEDPEAPDPSGFGAALTFGGAMHADQGTDHAWIDTEISLLARLLDQRVPTLGVCLGTQLLAAAAGAEVRRAAEPEIGWREVELTGAGAADPVLGSLPDRFSAFQWHSYETALPPGAVALARSPVCLQGYRVGSHAWGIQFHAEVTAADAAHWTDHAAAEPAAIRVGLDPALLRAQTAPRIEAWNRLGRALCGRFLTAVESARLGAGRPT